jgi:hypothetical protein
MGITIPTMGMNSKPPSTQTSLADALFSGTQQRVLGLIFGRPVNPTLMTRKELAKRVAGDSAFVTRVLAQPKLWLIGGDNDLAI